MAILTRRNNKTPLGIYIHIPFCRSKCQYCDFYSMPCKDDKLMDSYLDAICAHLKEAGALCPGYRVDTVYFGGGTPSYFGADALAIILTAIRRNFDVATDAEITFEANPDSVTDRLLHRLKAEGFNRVSLGVQCDNDEILKKLGRPHTYAQAVTAYQRIRKAGFRNVSLDLMYGLPGETAEGWEYDLQQALQLQPEHISAYHLIYEENTALWTLREQHRVEEADEDLSVTLFKQLIHRLKEHGYQHYEISNFSLPGFHSRHNSSYWTGKKYLGCGPSAHSYNGTSRQWNIASLDKYIAGINNHAPIYEIENLDLYTRYNDFVITTIRTSAGMSLTLLKNTFGDTLYNYCLRMARPHLNQGTLEITNNTLKLTEAGIFISDGIMSDMLWVD